MVIVPLSATVLTESEGGVLGAVSGFSVIKLHLSLDLQGSP